MPELVIADTSCFIALSRTGGLWILKELYGTVTTTSIVRDEFGSPLPEWILISNPVDEVRLRMLSLQLDRGEASAIALALETPECSIILDERKGRNLALALGLVVTGTLGVIVKAKHSGLLDSVEPWLARFQDAGFRYSPEVEEAVLRAAGER
jgi:predicted nucleic acid-binding protein